MRREGAGALLRLPPVVVPSLAARVRRVRARALMLLCRQVNDTWIAQALDEGRDLFPRSNHHGQLQLSFVYDALQCGSGSLQQQLLQLHGYIPRALCDAHALQVLHVAPSPPLCFANPPAALPLIFSMGARLLDG